MGQSKTIHFISLGCPKNRVDTEVMLGVSDNSGYRLVQEPSEAEVIVVNTCGFIESAKAESIDTILEMSAYKAQGKCQQLVVAGCLSQRYGSELERDLPEVDYFLGSSDMLKLGTILNRDTKQEQVRMGVGNPAEYLYQASHPRLLSGPRHSAYVKIAEGCSRKCSFCAIPSFRGKQRSRSIEDLVLEAERLADMGVVELNVISQDTVSYGRDLAEEVSLSKLVQALGEIPKLRWIRLFYLYPEKLTQELIELLAHHPKILPYVDMPLQHASDAMLRRMRRGHGGDRLRSVVERLRNEIPQLTFRTAFIAGHPGESEADFEELCEFVRWAEFDHMGVFLYSHEEGTHSGAMTDLVERKIAEKRQRKLMTLQRSISRRKLKRWVGQTLEVLVEAESDESEFLLQGRHRGQAPDIDGHVILANGTAQPGEVRKALVTASTDYDLVANLYGAEATQPELPPGVRLPKTHKSRLPLVA